MDDLISRQAAIVALHDEIVRRRISEDTNDDGALDEFDTEAILRRLPSAQPEPPEPEEMDYMQPHKKIGVLLEIGQPKSEERTAESAQNVPNDELISRYER